VLSYRVILDVPLPLVLFVSRLLAEHRREIGTRDGTRALTCWKQAVFALAWFRDRPDIRRLGAGFGISQATAYRYKDEAVAVLAARAPSLREALDRAAEQGLPYLILDGTLISSDRCADKKTSKKGKEIDKWYSGKAHEPAGNVQALAAPGGVPLWVSDVLPGSTHDLTAARDLVLPGARPYLKNMPVLADSGYEGAGAGVHVPVKECVVDTQVVLALVELGPGIELRTAPPIKRGWPLMLPLGYLSVPVNARHASAVNASIPPERSFVSRTMTTLAAPATSTHASPLPE
jgi:hypothetical protein